MAYPFLTRTAQHCMASPSPCHRRDYERHEGGKPLALYHKIDEYDWADHQITVFGTSLSYGLKRSRASHNILKKGSWFSTKVATCRGECADARVRMSEH